MNKKEKIEKILNIFKKIYPNPKCVLNHKTPFELLVAVSLSAQCTDKRVNIVTDEMFRKKNINSPEQFSQMELGEIEVLIKSTGFYKNKAKNIKKTSEILLNSHNGKVPKTMKELVTLAGVGRKTANVVLGEIWGIAVGITVDTHVKRVSNLIGVVKTSNPIIIERELMKIVQKKQWINFSHYLILHGRDKCIARRPQCNSCQINIFCDFFQKK